MEIKHHVSEWDEMILTATEFYEHAEFLKEAKADILLIFERGTYEADDMWWMQGDGTFYGSSEGNGIVKFGETGYQLMCFGSKTILGKLISVSFTNHKLIDSMRDKI